MPDTTERPPAREVLAAAADYYLVHSSDKMRCADAQLTALAAAGYPVAAGPALVEALEATIEHFDNIDGNAAIIAEWIDGDLKDLPVATKARAALALAKQEPQP